MLLLDYYRAALADGGRPRIDFGRAHKVPIESLRNGLIDATFASDMVREARQSFRIDGETEAAKVVVAPTLLKSSYEHGTVIASEALAAPFVVPAVLDTKGRLSPTKSMRPWIPRDHLDGADGRWAAIGTLEDCDRFLERAEDPQDSWSDVLSFVDAMSEAVAGAPACRIEIEHHFRLNVGAILAESPPVPARHILRLVKSLDPSQVPGCLSTVVRSAPARPLLEGEYLRDIARRHLGQIGGGHALADRQREALLHALALQDGEILAVSGPPGTGKTTLIGSLVATLVVDAALADPVDNAEPTPPVIVVASTNNRALRSAIESLDSATDADADPIDRRWMPAVGSHAMLMPSTMGAKGGPDLQWGRFGSPPEGIIAEVHAPEVLFAAERTMLDSAIAYFGRSFDRVEDVAAALRDALQEHRSRLVEVLEGADLVREACSAGRTSQARLDEAHERVRAATEQKAALPQLREVVDCAARQISPGPLVALIDWLLGRRQDRWSYVRRALADAGLAHPLLTRVGRPRRSEVLAALEESLPQAEARVEAELAAAKSALLAAQAEADAVKRWEELVHQLQRDFKAPEGLAAAARHDPAALEALLDVSLRARMFRIAARWWETQWLLLTRKRQKRGKPLAFLNQPGRSGGELRFRHLACLTPCFVSTLHMLPRHLGIWTPDAPGSDGGGHLTDFIDLLVIDEAGQVSPEIGAPALALARRAVVVGDVYQIEPIPALSEAADAANLKKYGFSEAQAASMRARGLTVAAGNLMAVAHASTAFARPDEEGMFLNEHRRCPAEIVAFCNDLVYRGRLLPRTPPPLGGQRLPPMGWAHVRGRAKIVGRSWANEAEAEEIANWLARRRPEIEQWFGRDIADVAAIVTPYAPQSRVLRVRLAEQGLPRTLTVGTVHALQGAEREIVILSPTVTADTLDGLPFFDRAPNVLNVAASRARHAFMVCGDMSLFDALGPSTRPSSVLARHLFRSPTSELPDVTAQPELRKLDAAEITLLATLEDHRRTLRDALAAAREKLVIVSPWISSAPVAADDVLAGVRAATERGVEVTIVYNGGFMADPGRAANLPTLDALKQSGACVVPTRLHAKAIVVDRSWLAVGSFNWLSASRNPAGRYAMGETSLRCTGSKAAMLCEEYWEWLRVSSGPS